MFIFVIYLDEPINTTATSYLISIMLVSKRWYVLVDHTPSLWTQIHRDDVNLRLDLALAKSGPCPLNISVSPKEESDYHLPPYRKFTETLCRHIHRWQSAKVTLLDYDVDLVQLLDSPAPLLETVDIGVYPGEDDTARGFVNLFNGHATRLHSLRLTAVAIPWRSNILSGLSTLVVQSVNHLVPSVTETVHILLACPGLRVLGLENMEIAADLAPHQLPFAHLSALEVLNLTSLTAPVAHQLLSHIDATPRHSFSFSFSEMPSRDIDFDPASFLHYVVDCIPEISKGMLVIKPHQHSISSSSTSPTYNLRLWFGNMPAFRSLQCLGPSLSSKLPALPVKTCIGSERRWKPRGTP